MGAAAVIGACIYLVGRFLFGQDWPAGFATIVLLLMLSISMTGFFLGIIGEYLGRVFDEVRGRPVYLERGVLRVEGHPVDRSPGAG